MQNVDIKSVVKDGKLRVPYNPKTLQGFLDLKDLAEVASEVILNPANHNLATYELVGENTTLESVAQMPIIHQFRGLSDTRCELVPRDKLLESGMVHLKVQGPDMREGLGRMLYYYDRRGIPGNSNTIRWLLGRSATTWEGFIQREAWMY
ncbi:hypothetical protein QCA50_003642 [Cerrena zonata]|uniref:Uncharacterized protein n=1 Tax=Cerrena zonata TaxID=2478898 RepID=A0AAW0GWR2_9APHY